MSKKILYIHGLESGPMGRKASYLRGLNQFEIHCDQLPIPKGFKACIDQQVESLKAYKPDIVVGSSFGGAVASELIMRREWTGPTLLLAPAWNEIKRRMPDQVTWDNCSLANATSRVIILHGDKDDVVPLSDSQALVKTSSKAELHVLADDHPLNSIIEDDSIITWIENLQGRKTQRVC